MTFDYFMFAKARQLAGPDHDMNDQLTIYYLAHMLAADHQHPIATPSRLAEWEYMAKKSEAAIRAFISKGI